MNVAKLYKTDGEIKEVTPQNGKRFTLQELQDMVGGYIEFVHLDLDRIMIVNEEGRLLKLPENENVTNLLPNFMILHLRVFGNILIANYAMLV